MRKKLDYRFTAKGYKFINPYNFVSINLKEKNTPEISETEEKLTGVLKCSLYPKTPIAIPDTDTYSVEREHKTYDFFHYEDNVPVIPGSSLRGVIRSVYETLTESCMSTAKEKTVLSRRSTSPMKPVVFIKNGDKWSLYPATRYAVPKTIIDKKAFHTGDIVSITLLKNGDMGYSERRKTVKSIQHYIDGDDNVGIKGYLFIGEYMSNKKYESVFYVKPYEKPIAIAPEKIDRLMKTLDEIYKIYNKNADGKRMYKDYEDAKKKGIIPIWRDENNGKVSLACIGRIVYDKNLGEVLGQKAPCKKRADMCKTCSLFGMASDENMGSRIRISDAFLASDSDSYMLSKETFKELASPKYSHLPFYLKPVADTSNWSYDNTDIRGRKFYWHSDKFEPANEKNKRNVTMQVVKPVGDKELKFGFDIFFDGVTQTQLDELIWSLTLGENKANSSLCYKIGHGKPLGLGSAKITVDKKMIRTFTDEYTISEETIAENPGFPKDMCNEKTRMQVLKIMDMSSTAGQDVVYPYVVKAEGVIIPKNKKNALAPMNWFSTNLKMGSKSEPYSYLPDVMDDDLCLDACEAYNINNNEDDSRSKKSNKSNRNTGQYSK